MDELGSILQEAREARGLTLDQVEAELKIRAKFLSALEDGRYDSLPTAVHVRGYLRNYARHLGLDPDPLIERYEVSKNYQSPPIPTDDATNISASKPLTSRTDQPFFDPVNLSLDGSTERNPQSYVQIAIFVAALMVIGLLANRFLLTSQDNGSAVEEAVAQIANAQATQEAGGGVDNGILPASTNNTGSVDDVISTQRNDEGSLILPTPTATRVSLPATMETIQLKLDITQRQWFRVTIDNEVVFEGIGKKNDSFEWEALDFARLETGNANGIFVTINDRALGKLGGRNEILDERWEATGG
jgi:cytoskeletal protein RodZ